jgi:uncharacterized protein (DUF433 family)
MGGAQQCFRGNRAGSISLEKTGTTADTLGVMDYSGIITIEPGKRSGKPCIRGTRMTVADVLEYLAGGMSSDELLDEFPDLSAQDIRACLAYAADSLKNGGISKP